MHLDLEQTPQFGGHMQMGTVAVKPDVPAYSILPQRNAMPAIGRPEARETDWHSKIFQLKITLKRLAEAIRQHLDCRRRHSLTATPLEAHIEVILRGECAIDLILRFKRRQHLVIEQPRLTEAGHQLLALHAVRIQAILERSHALIVLHRTLVSQAEPSDGYQAFTCAVAVCGFQPELFLVHHALSEAAKRCAPYHAKSR